VDNSSGQTGSAQARTRSPAPIPDSVTGWIRAGTLDPELAALTSILIEGGLPVVVAASNEARADGWTGAQVRDALGRTLLASGRTPLPTIRIAAPVTVDAASLESVLARMPLLSFDAVDEAGARVAIVLIVDIDEAGGGWLVRATHFLRPPLRDGHGHLQRQGPAVLATWDPGLRRFEHFWWAVLPELAVLIERHSGDLESEIAGRTDLLAGLVAHRVDDQGAVRLAIEAARIAADTANHRH